MNKYCSIISMETIFVNTKNSKTNKPQKFVLNLFLNTWKNIRKKFKNNKLKIIAPTWNDKFELLNGSYSVSNVQDYIEYIIKNMKH